MIAKEIWDKAKALFMKGDSLSEISKATGISRGQIGKKANKDLVFTHGFSRASGPLWSLLYRRKTAIIHREAQGSVAGAGDSELTFVPKNS